jgi:hypothetical protein
MHRLIGKDPRNAERIRPYIGGEEVNDSPTHAHHRYAIDFADFPLRRDDLGIDWAVADEKRRTICLREGIVPLDYPEPVAADWPDLLAIVEERVKPERLAQSREVRARFWWKFAERAPALYDSIRRFDRVLGISRHTVHLGFVLLPASSIFAESLLAVGVENFGWFALLQSRTHEVWARFFASSLEDRLRYTPSDCFGLFDVSSGKAAGEQVSDRGTNQVDDAREGCGAAIAPGPRARGLEQAVERLQARVGVA